LLIGTKNSMVMAEENIFKIAVIGLGYVGLPLAVEFGRIFSTTGFDINSKRIHELKKGNDHTLEITRQDFNKAKHLSFTSDIKNITSCNIFIITVPTPIDSQKRPDLTPLTNASEMIGKILKKQDIVIYESTVYPGATEEICVPILEKNSNLSFNKDFYCGYSPERINPGDKEHRLTSIKKVTSGSTPEIASKVNSIYKKIITAGTHMAASIKVAEAAKVIENTQRDVNIALINELALIFDKLGIDTKSVLDAAGTKWNFLPFKPGLVGGHCIGVDPYYLTHKALEVGYNPEMILAGRRLNDNMSSFVVEKVLSLMSSKKVSIKDSNILIMGLTFKENCPDLRNTKVIDVINGFKSRNCNVDVYDTWADQDQAIQEHGVSLIEKPIQSKYDAIVLAVAHDDFLSLTLEQIKVFGKENHVIYDLKYIFDNSQVDGRL
jgi:UDP-N-acetyl-D-glucosamine/UDP-N-acetyl-D-galactosamine dehydrogenase